MPPPTRYTFRSRGISFVFWIIRVELHRERRLSIAPSSSINEWIERATIPACGRMLHIYKRNGDLCPVTIRRISLH